MSSVWPALSASSEQSVGLGTQVPGPVSWSADLEIEK